MQVMHPDGRLAAAPHRAGAVHQPTILDLLAGGLLLATVVMHVVAMVPHYFGGPGEQSLWSQPDQAALYSVLAAGWAIAFALLLTGPARAGSSAGLAVGLTATELGFRLSDLGEVFRHGTGQASTGLWLMTAAWIVGVYAAATVVLAARRRLGKDYSAPRRRPAAWVEAGPAAEEAAGASSPAWPTDDVWGPRADPVDAAIWGPQPEPPEGPLDAAPADAAVHGGEAEVADAAVPGGEAVWWSAGNGWVDTTAAIPAQPGWDAAADSTAAIPVDSTAAIQVSSTALVPVDSTAAIRVDSTSVVPGQPAAGAADAPYDRGGPIVLVALLALATAGAFLPAWDRFTATSTITGRSVSFTRGNAFSGPWQVVIGNAFVALVLAGLPILVVRLRHRAIGAAVVAGSLIVLAAQFTAAVVQIDQAVPPSIFGLTPTQFNQLGLQSHMSLTGWFTLDVLVAFALFATAMVLGHVREAPVQASSAGTWPNAPESRSAASLPWS